MCPDFEGALQNRLSVREEHLKGLQGDREDFWLWGGTFTSIHTFVPLSMISHFVRRSRSRRFYFIRRSECVADVL
jgi:hypothetical protein